MLEGSASAEKQTRFQLKDLQSILNSYKHNFIIRQQGVLGNKLQKVGTQN